MNGQLDFFKGFHYCLADNCPTLITSHIMKVAKEGQWQQGESELNNGLSCLDLYTLLVVLLHEGGHYVQKEEDNYFQFQNALLVNLRFTVRLVT